MVRRYTFCVLLVFIAVGTVAAQTPGCEVPDGMTKEQKLPCVRAGRMLLDQPTLSPTQLANGPGFDSAEPEKSRFAYSTADDTIVCYFRPHYAFAKVPGDSMKFQCWHMTADGAFYNRKGETVRVDDVKVVIEKDKSGEKSASLYARTDDKNPSALWIRKRDLQRQVARAVRDHVDAGHLRALALEQLDGGRTDAARGARDDAHAPVESPAGHQAVSVA